MECCVVIATLNRAEVLSLDTLPSLCIQNRLDFTVLIWDASDNEDTKKCCEEFRDKIKITYVKAPRKGLASQRNDSVAYCREFMPDVRYIIFLDDDVRLSNDAVEGVLNTFEKYPKIQGVGIPIVNSLTGYGVKGFLKKWLPSIFLLFPYKIRHSTKYVYAYYPKPCEKNETYVNWLTGCSMAYKINVFDNGAKFDERLQRFGGYSLGEDLLFSKSLSLRGNKLMTSIHGSLEHLLDSNSRLDIQGMTASLYYNMELIFSEIHKETSRFRKAGWKVLFWWCMRYKIFSLYRKALKQNETKKFWEGRSEAKKAIKSSV